MGFWLSFGAVAGLVLAFSGRQRNAEQDWQIGAKTQWVALIVTAPLLIVWLGQVPLISVLANIIMIPFISFVIVPLVLVYLACLLVGLVGVSELLIIVLQELMIIGLLLIHALADSNWMIYPPTFSNVEKTLVVLGCVLVLLPPGFVPRWFAVFCWLPIFSNDSSEMDERFLRVDILDVGQGLSVVITSANTTVLYDTGPSYSRRDAGEQIVVPTLIRLGKDRLDLMVVSHGDDDHAGGVNSILDRFPVQVLVSSDRRFGRDCIRGSIVLPDFSAEWFALDHQRLNRNSRSCVLLIRSEFGEILLPGDIEADAEYLLNTKLISARLLISPHHGSMSSSTPGFINSVNPAWVVHSNGHLNRFGHPHVEIAERYENRGVRQFQTAQSGSVSFIFTEDQVEIREARKTRPRFWYDAPL